MNVTLKPTRKSLLKVRSWYNRHTVSYSEGGRNQKKDTPLF